MPVECGGEEKADLATSPMVDRYQESSVPGGGCGKSTPSEVLMSHPSFGFEFSFPNAPNKWVKIDALWARMDEWELGCIVGTTYPIEVVLAFKGLLGATHVPMVDYNMADGLATVTSVVAPYTNLTTMRGKWNQVVDTMNGLESAPNVPLFPVSFTAGADYSEDVYCAMLDIYLDFPNNTSSSTGFALTAPLLQPMWLIPKEKCCTEIGGGVYEEDFCNFATYF